MGKLTFISGGARSGKSTFAINKAAIYGPDVAFIATAPYLDEDMEQRIKKHKEDRPSDWVTIEQELNVLKVLSECSNRFRLVIIECLTLWVSNLILNEKPEDEIYFMANMLIEEIKSSEFDTIVVASEVGQGVCPDNALALIFRDIAGRVNQIFANKADDVYYMVSGIPMKIKENGKNKFK